MSSTDAEERDYEPLLGMFRAAPGFNVERRPSRSTDGWYVKRPGKATGCVVVIYPATGPRQGPRLNVESSSFEGLPTGRTVDARNQADIRALARSLRGKSPPRASSNDDPAWHDPDELEFNTAADLAVEVDAEGEPRFLLSPVWPAGDYGMIGAEDKAGKSWACMDLAVSVASGTKWLGIFDTEVTGRVVYFMGEGGKRKAVRRLRAVCRSRGLDPNDVLPLIHVCLRVPDLTRDEAMRHVEAKVAEEQPVLVIIDPLYLAAGGAKSSDLFDMGAHLRRPQHICQRYGASLAVSHHWNLTGRGTGAKRLSGAGPSAWGRVLVSMALVGHKYTDPETKETRVTLDLEFAGDETPDDVVRIERRVWSDDPKKLSSPLHYEVCQLAREENESFLAGRPRSQRLVYSVLPQADEAAPMSIQAIGDELVARKLLTKCYRRPTIQKALTGLMKAEPPLADRTEEQPYLYCATPPDDDVGEGAP